MTNVLFDSYFLILRRSQLQMLSKNENEKYYKLKKCVDRTSNRSLNQLIKFR